MSFTSRDLRGWFHIFTSLPLVHTLNPDFWSDVFDLASSRTPKLLFMKTTALYDSRIKTSPDSRTSQIPDSQNFASFQPSWNRQQIREQEQYSAITFTYYQKVSMMYEIHPDLFMNVAFSRNRTFFSEDDLRIYPQIWQIRHFEGVRFLPNSPTLAPWVSGLTPTIRFHE
jgi:hypothetical protein